MVPRPDVVEMHDVTAHDPKFLVFLKVIFFIQILFSCVHLSTTKVEDGYISVTLFLHPLLTFFLDETFVYEQNIQSLFPTLDDLLHICLVAQ